MTAYGNVSGNSGVEKLNQQRICFRRGKVRLRRNSREAAAGVRAFTDDELDQAAPFSLSYGAPVTAQFVIEDHALRHSWHHLARIRKALRR